MEPKWLTLDIVRGSHLRAIAAAGGSTGFLDEGLPQSAIDRPRNLLAHGEASSINGLAAAYCFGIV